MQAVAVAEPDEDRRKLFSQEHDLEQEARYTGWKTLLNRDQLSGEVSLVLWTDAHVQPTLKALEKGYKVLLEK